MAPNDRLLVLRQFSRCRLTFSFRSMAAAAMLLMMAPPICSAVETPPAGSTAVTFRLGDMQLTSLLDATDALTNDGTVFGMSVGAQAVAQVLQRAGVPTNRIPLSINVLLARSKDRVMLFDTGLGPAGPRCASTASLRTWSAAGCCHGCVHYARPP